MTGDAANITGKIALDDGTANAITDTNPTEVEDGKYRFDLTQAETNGDKLEMFAESSTADILVIGLPEVIYTRPANFTDLSVTTIWAYADRTLTQAAASVTTAVTGSNVTTYTHATWSVSLTGLGSIADRTNMLVGIKSAATDADTAAQVLIDVSTGLLYVGGAVAGTAGDGSITVDDEDAGDITITLKPASSTLVTPGNYVYDVKKVTATTVDVMSIGGYWRVIEAVTDAIT
jgi:hypothetical protein